MIQSNGIQKNYTVKILTTIQFWCNRMAIESLVWKSSYNSSEGIFRLVLQITGKKDRFHEKIMLSSTCVFRCYACDGRRLEGRFWQWHAQRLGTVVGKWRVDKKALTETSSEAYSKIMFGDVAWKDYSVAADVTVGKGKHPCNRVGFWSGQARKVKWLSFLASRRSTHGTSFSLDQQ